jgi:N-acetylglucosamine repressor
MTRITALRPELVGKLNERQVLRLIQARGPISRAEVARRSGLSPPTVSKAVASLLAAGLLEETATSDNARGRPAVNLRLATEAVQVIGVVIDADVCEVVSAGLDGVLHTDAHTFPTPASYPKLIDAIEKHCRAVVGKPDVRTLGIGVSLPGLIDDRAGRGVLSPNLPATNGQAPAADLAARLGLAGAVVQELHALCLAERHYGQATGVDDFAVIDVGVGVGLGVMSGGRLLTGRSGLAGEIGHVTVVADGGHPCGCGNTGCLETECNDAAFARRVSRRLNREVGFEEAVAIARSGRGPLAKELHETAVYLSVAVAAVVNLFNPAAVFLHTRLFEADDGLFDRVVELTRKRALPPSFADCKIVRAKGHKRQGAVAAAVRHLTDALADGIE